MVSDTPTDGRCNYEYSPDDEYDVDSGYCEGHPMDNGRCYHHGGQAENGGAPEGNENAATHRAYAEHAVKSLTESEADVFDEVAEDLENPESAQDVARHAASYCLIMGHRAGDDRWFRRYESICDKFGIAPENVERHEHTGEGGGPIEVTVKRERYDGE